MSQSIIMSANVHTDGHDLEVECRTIFPADGRHVPLLTIGPVHLFASKDQLRQLRDAIIAYLVDEEVPFDDPAWADEGLWTPSDATLRLDVDDLVPDAPDWASTQAPDYVAAMARDGVEVIPCGLPPISGASLDGIPAEYHPTEEDLAELARWSAELDAKPAAPNRYSPESLANIRRILYGV